MMLARFFVIDAQYMRVVCQLRQLTMYVVAVEGGTALLHSELLAQSMILALQTGDFLLRVSQ